MLSTAASIVSLFAAQALAHGAVTSYVINGVTYPGYTGFSPASSPPTIQRQWPDYNPTMTVTDAKVKCNGGTSAALNATVPAGGTIKALWQQWTHQQGPIMVWMYKCASDTDFKSCDGSGKGWFKIDQQGMTAPPLSGNSWGTAVIYNKKEWTSTVPKSLKSGTYLVRHELLALHQSNTPQFYAECAQVIVSGGGSATPGDSFKATIPGYASQNDPGIMIDIYSSKATTYTPPGPAVWTG